MEWICRAVGAFYIAGGVWTLRQLWLAWRFERRFAGGLSLSLGERAADAAAGLGAGLSLLSGLMLFMLNGAAPVAFLAAWGVQAIYLLWSRQRALRGDLILSWGHGQAVHAFALYTVVTFSVLLLQQTTLFQAL